MDCQAMTMATDAWTEGEDGTQAAYSERLWPSWWAWLAAPALVSVLAIAYGAAYDAVWGWLILAAGTALAWGVLLATAPVVRVDERVFRAGRARLPRSCVGGVEPLGREAMRERLRSGDARAFLMLRSWSSPQGVLVNVADPHDPHPYWLISTRRPDRLAEALREAPGASPAGAGAE